MARRKRNEGFLDELHEFLLVVPSWVGPPLAILFYLILRFLLPAVLDGGDEDVSTRKPGSTASEPCHGKNLSTSSGKHIFGKVMPFKRRAEPAVTVASTYR